MAELERIGIVREQGEFFDFKELNEDDSKTVQKQREEENADKKDKK